MSIPEGNYPDYINNQLLKECNYEAEDIEQENNIIEEYNRYHQRKLKIVLAPHENSDESDSESIEFSLVNETPLLIGVGNYENLDLPEEIILQNELFEILEGGRKRKKWCILNKKKIIIQDFEVGMNELQEIQLNEIESIIP